MRRHINLLWMFPLLSSNASAAEFGTFDLGQIIQRSEAIKSQRLHNELLQREVQRQGKEITQQQELGTLYKEGYADGFNSGRSVAEQELIEVRRESLNNFASSILTATSEEDLQELQNGVVRSLEQHPNAYWLKAMLILIDHRLTELSSTE